MAIGPILREARQNKQLTTSQVAEMTRMKVQIVDDLENDDFHRIAATIYGKGFIKLFAECVDIDPAPLLDDYLRQMGTPLPPQLPTPDAQDPGIPDQEKAPDPAPADASPKPLPAEDLFSYADHTRRAPKPVSERPTSAPSAQAAPTTSSRRVTTTEVLAKLRPYYERIRAGFVHALETVIKGVTESGENEKWIQRGLIFLGVIVLILILIPLARTVMTSRTPASLPDNELILFVPPPEPYLD